MEKIACFKIMEDERMELCGFYNSREDAIEYLTYVQQEIDKSFQFALEGQYVFLPALYFDIKRKPVSK